eukprot:m.589775 g.589775  ORF g.589775 m.589775 type:complete len:161 (+) comp58009_c0_seq8:1014-1496(+)
MLGVFLAVWLALLGKTYAVGDQTAPNVFVWGHPRCGSSVFLNALASSGHWGKNIHMEPYCIMGIFEPLGVPSPAFGFESYPTSFTGMMEEIKARGPFVIKEFPYTLVRSGCLFRQAFLKDPNFKHIFLIRNPKDSISRLPLGPSNTNGLQIKIACQAGER